MASRAIPASRSRVKQVWRSWQVRRGTCARWHAPVTISSTPAALSGSPPARTFQHNEHPVRRRAVRTFNLQVISYRTEEPVGDRHDPLVAALALGDEQETLPRPQILEA